MLLLLQCTILLSTLIGVKVLSVTRAVSAAASMWCFWSLTLEAESVLKELIAQSSVFWPFPHHELVESLGWDHWSTKGLHFSPLYSGGSQGSQWISEMECRILLWHYNWADKWVALILIHQIRSWEMNASVPLEIPEEIRPSSPGTAAEYLNHMLNINQTNTTFWLQQLMKKVQLNKEECLWSRDKDNHFFRGFPWLPPTSDIFY